MTMRRKMLRRVSVVGFSSVLSVSLLFALAGVSKYLGLQYNLGYTVKPIDLTILSKQLDPSIWLASTTIGAVTSVLISFQNTRAERTSYMLFFLADLVEIVMFFVGQSQVSFILSLVLGMVFASLTSAYAKTWRMRTQPASTWLTCACFLGILATIELLALLSRILSVFPNLSNLTFLAQSAYTQLQLSEFLFTFSPILLLATILVWVPVLPMITRRGANHYEWKHSIAQQPRKCNLRVIVPILGFAFLLAIFVPLSPYITKPVPRGVDIRFYYSLLNSTATFQGAVSDLGTQSHGPYLLFLYAIRLLTGWNTWQAVVVAPSFLALFFAASTYLLMHQISGSSVASAVAAVFAASWLHTTIGLFAAIYANWFAMSFVMLFLYFLSKTLEVASTYSRILAIAAGYATALTHVWTWVILVAALGVAFALTISKPRAKPIQHRISGEALTTGVLFLAISLPIIALSLTLPSLNAAVRSGANDVVGSMSLTRLSQVLFLVGSTLTRYVGDILAYPVPLVLTPLGALYLAKTNAKSARMLVSWLIVTSIITLLLDPWFQWRVLYIIPFEIFAASGVMAALAVVDWLAKKTAVGIDHMSAFLLVKCLIVTLVLLDSANYALTAASTLPLS
jgi:hypothetical protein